jgi:hypothetical protein
MIQVRGTAASIIFKKGRGEKNEGEAFLLIYGI